METEEQIDEIEQPIAEIEEPTAEINEEAEEMRLAAERIEPAIEALLFVASEPLETKRLAKLTGEDEKAVALAIQELEERYSNGGIVLREVAGGYRFATSSAVRDVVEAYLLPPKTSLSTPALEALAIVAHMQPVTKSEIEAIRGVNSDSVVNTLIDRGLAGEAGRKDVVGRPMTYKTTSLFLESFGLNSLDDLPQLELEPGQPLELNLLVPTPQMEQAEQSAEPAEEPQTEVESETEPAETEPETEPVETPEGSADIL